MIKKISILSIMAFAVIVFISVDGASYLSFASLKEHRDILHHYVNNNLVLSVALFIGLYTIVAAFALPVGTLLTLTGGFLFGAVYGTLYVVIGATLGATILYYMVMFFLEGSMRQKVDKMVGKMQQGLNDNALSYMLFLRFIPLFPFFGINIVAAILRVKPSIFIGGTFVGIIPGTFIYALSGAGLGKIFDSGDNFSPKDIVTPELIGGLIGLAVIALIPILYKKYTTKRAS